MLFREVVQPAREYLGGTCREESIRGITKEEVVDEITQLDFCTRWSKA